MGKRIKKCRECGRYTLSEICPDCGGACISPKPASYSPEDRYGKYRRIFRQNLNSPRKE
ncbi:RNA-protein complex protein Nop10 [Methanimicrococcus hacksteinii]|uniref:RNA-protein complex protein Nop10 n=1 Tax=Methanimicrococcus hacksteinii TaxID=3028293 RepID=UPI00298F158B|nr:RNA-protein complex protein Nop10 [Methanimicrococcus sp. At1]